MYKVLWVDDEFDTQDLQQVADAAYNRGINMDTACKSAEEALAHLEHPDDFDAVILDARFFSTKGSVAGQEGLKGLRKIDSKLKDLLSKNKYLPAFIYSGQKELVHGEDFKDTYEEEYPIYDKYSGEEREKMFSDIIKTVNSREETKAKLQYADLFEVCNGSYYFDETLSESLLNYVVDINNGNTKNNNIFNSMRKVMDDFFSICTRLGLLNGGIKEINAQSKFLCDPAMREYIPEYVQNSIRFVVQTTQPGSHGTTKTDSDTKNGVAPYLIRSLFYAISNILVWWRRFIDGNPNYSSIIETASKIHIDITYLVEQDENGDYHCGEYLMYAPKGAELLGKHVSVVEYTDNTQPSNTRYKFFAKKVKS